MTEEIEKLSRKIIESLNTQISKDEDGNVKIVYDGDNLQKFLSNLNLESNEKIILQSGGELGINVMMESSSLGIRDLKKLAEDSLKVLRDTIPTKRMIGVD